MINGTTSARLSGWIRLVPGDGFGIPLFVNDTNLEFIPETDNMLRIVAFHKFYNDEGYQIDRVLPGGKSSRTYTIGDGTPIPFVSNGIVGVADSEQSSKTFLTAQGVDPGNPIVKAVADILLKAETGAFERESSARGRETFEARHATVLTGDPVHSRYWIEQYERTASELSANKSVSMSPSRDKLRQVGSDWLRRFSVSGDPQILIRFLDVTEHNNLLTADEVKAIYYVVIASLISREDFRSLLQTDLRKQAKHRIPEGLYYYELSKKNLREPSGDLVFASSVDLISQMEWILQEGERRRDFRLSMAVSDLLFGSGTLPLEIHAVASKIALYLADVIERGVDDYRGPPTQQIKDDLVATYLALQTLRQIMDWQDRSKTSTVVLGLSARTTWFMQEWIDQRSRPSEGQ